MLASSRGALRWRKLAGRCKASAPTQGLRRPERIMAGPGAAPLRRLRRHLPLQGRLYGQLPLGTAPLQGAAESSAACGGESETEQVQRSQNASMLQHGYRKPVMRRKAQPEGCIAALRREISCKARQNPALCFVGDDLRAKSRHFVLCAPKHRLRAAVPASSRKPCDGANPKRRAKTTALQSLRNRVRPRKRQPLHRGCGGPPLPVLPPVCLIL